MKIRRVGSMLAAFVLSVSSLVAFVSAPAHAANRTWTGGGGNTSFNTAGNWSGGVVPTTGDNLIFDVSTLSADTTLTNNISGLSVGSLTFQGSSSSFYGFKLEGQALTVGGGITSSANSASAVNLNLTLSANQTFSFTGDGTILFGDPASIGTGSLNLSTYNLGVSSVSGCQGMVISQAVSGSGSITKSGAGLLSINAANPSYSGAIVAGAGTLYANNAQALGAASSGTTVASGATLALGIEADATFNEPLTTSGSGVSGLGALKVGAPNTYASSCSGGSPSDVYTATLAGGLTLQADTVYAGDHNANVTGAYTSNGFTLSVAPGTVGSITTSEGTVSAPQETVVIPAGDDQPSQFVNVGNNQTYVINGVRGGVSVQNGGTLKGEGQVGDTTVNEGGVIAPGQSPGCLTMGALSLDGSYEFELGGSTACSGYDQLKVSGTVTLGSSAQLQLAMLNGFVPMKDQKFMIIENDGSDAVSGTFQNLEEGATFTANGIVFQVSYIGGDGNDVVLSALNVPATPNTGFGVLLANPLATLIGSVAAAGALLLVGRRLQLARR